MYILDTVKRVLRDYHNRINALEDEKFDLEYAVKKKDYEVSKQKQTLYLCYVDLYFHNKHIDRFT